MQTMYLIGATGRSKNYTDVHELAREWIRRDDPTTTIRFVTDNGVTFGTPEHMRPVYDALNAARA